MITVTGASGKTGLALLHACARRGLSVRGTTNREGRLEALAEAGAHETAIADLTDRESLARALAGSSVVYHVCPNMRSDEAEIGERMIDVCRQLGVGRFVYHSVLHPQIEAMPHHWSKLRVEERLIESGLEFTILQPAAYMQNVKAQWRGIVEDGSYQVPYAASTRIGMVDLRDVAEAAATVLGEQERHVGAIYELCGSEVLDQRDVASVIAERLATPVTVSVIDRDEWARRAREAQSSPYAIASLVAMFEHYEQHGFRGNPRVLEWLLGRSTTTFGAVVDRWVGAAGRYL